MHQKKNVLINQILEEELDMFLTVSAIERASCQDHPDEFKKNRRAQFSAWSEETLKSYLNDLMAAKKNGRNLMTLKYARMDNLVPPLNKDPLIDKIVGIQYAWQKEMFQKYPNLMSGARSIDSREDTSLQTSFETYLRGELETYSCETLGLLYEDIKTYQKAKKSLNEALYEFLVKDLGYQSLEEAEATAKAALKMPESGY